MKLERSEEKIDPYHSNKVVTLTQTEFYDDAFIYAVEKLFDSNDVKPVIGWLQRFIARTHPEEKYKEAYEHMISRMNEDMHRRLCVMGNLDSEDILQSFCTCTGNWPRYQGGEKPYVHQKQCPLNHEDIVITQLIRVLEIVNQHRELILKLYNVMEDGGEPCIVYYYNYEIINSCLKDNVDAIREMMDLLAISAGAEVYERDNIDVAHKLALNKISKTLKIFEGRYDPAVTYLFYSDKKAQKFKEAVEALLNQFREAYNTGKRKGSSILHGLAEGEITANDFESERDKNDR